jgi:hypothetical protein
VNPDEEERHASAERARRRSHVFGDVLPGTTRDDRLPPQGEDHSSADADEDWLRANVPPHHGG